MPLTPTFLFPGPETGDTIERLLAKLINSQIQAASRGTLLASAARTASTSSAAVDWSLRRAACLFLNISAASGTGGLRPVVEYLDPVSGIWRGSVILGSAPITTTGMFPFLIGAGLGGVLSSSLNAGAIAAVPLLSNLRITVSHSDATSYTYSLGFEIV